MDRTALGVRGPTPDHLVFAAEDQDPGGFPSPGNGVRGPLGGDAEEESGAREVEPPDGGTWVLSRVGHVGQPFGGVMSGTSLRWHNGVLW